MHVDVTPFLCQFPPESVNRIDANAHSSRKSIEIKRNKLSSKWFALLFFSTRCWNVLNKCARMYFPSSHSRGLVKCQVMISEKQTFSNSKLCGKITHKLNLVNVVRVQWKKKIGCNEFQFNVSSQMHMQSKFEDSFY